MPVQETDIVWTDHSANLWVGCANVSQGCKNCWAETMARRFDRTEYSWTTEYIDDNLSVYDEDISSKLAGLDPGWCFYPSSSDPFLPYLDPETTAQYIRSLRENEHLCFQVLTKWGPEADRNDQGGNDTDYEPRQTTPDLPDNVMLGVSCESEQRLYRLDWLRKQNAATKFVSFEPLIERIGDVDLSGIDWVIVGGESHSNAEERRKMKPEWAAHLFQVAQEQDVPYLFKQHSGRFAEQTRRLMLPGEFLRRYEEFPETPGDLPNAPAAFIGE